MLKNKDSASIKGALTSIMSNYFSLLDSASPPTGLYEDVISEVEKVLISETMKYTSNNQLRASEILGINRNTLRKKLQNLFDDE